VYSCPNSEGNNEETVYKMIVGDNAVGNLQGVSIAQIKRPHDKTIMVVEADMPVHWMSPSDFSVEDFKTAVSCEDREKAKAIRDAHWENRYGGYWKDVEEEGRIVSYFHPTEPNELGFRQILGLHWGNLHVLCVDGTVKTFKDGKRAISDIEAMSRIRE
jgi:hypothetical protein